MTSLPTTIGLLREVAEQTADPTSVPPATLFKLYNRLIEAYTNLGEEMCRKFSAKERSYLARKIAQAKAYQGERYKEKISVKDAEMTAMLSVGGEAEKEIEAAAEYEGYRTLIGSVDRAIDFTRSLISYSKYSEKLPSTPYHA